MTIGFVLHFTGTVENPPVWGEEVQARLFCKELQKLGVDTKIINQHEEFDIDPDVTFYFSSTIPKKRGKKRILWVQNHWDYAKLSNNDYDIILHSAKNLQPESSPYPLFRMPADPELYYPREISDKFPRVDIVYVSNNIKGPINDIWLEPFAYHFGADRFHIYGSMWNNTRLNCFCKGAPTGLVVPDIFVNAKIILSLHTKEHQTVDAPTCRIPEALLMKKPIVSDPVGKDFYGPYVYYANNAEELILKAEEILNNYDIAKNKAIAGSEFVKNFNTFTIRSKELLNIINSIIGN